VEIRMSIQAWTATQQFASAALWSPAGTHTNGAGAAPK
jgi:hypothetical protein